MYERIRLVVRQLPVLPLNHTPPLKIGYEFLIYLVYGVGKSVT